MSRNVGSSKKNITFLAVGLMGLFCFTACSQNESVDGSSITTGTAGVVSTPSNGAGVIAEPELTWESQSNQSSADTVAFSKEFTTLLDGFDQLNGRITETYELYLQYPESDKALGDYLVVLTYLIELLRSATELNPPDDFLMLCDNFTTASLELADCYESVGKMIQVGYVPKTEEAIAEFFELNSEVVAVSERFSNTAFALMVALEGDNLAG